MSIEHVQEIIYINGISTRELTLWMTKGYRLSEAWGHKDGGIVVHWSRTERKDDSGADFKGGVEWE